MSSTNNERTTSGEALTMTWPEADIALVTMTREGQMISQIENINRSYAAGTDDGAAPISRVTCDDRRASEAGCDRAELRYHAAFHVGLVG
jgi:hypothetical protein